MLLLPLHQTPFKVKIGRKYGLVGANGAGKSTLMRAIAGGNLAGFPTELITVYVECEIIGEKADMTVLQYIMTDSKVITFTPSISPFPSLDLYYTIINTITNTITNNITTTIIR